MHAVYALGGNMALSRRNFGLDRETSDVRKKRRDDLMVLSVLREMIVGNFTSGQGPSTERHADSVGLR